MKQAPSVAAMVSSMDPDFIRYFTRWSLNPRPAHESGQSQEEVIDIAGMLSWHLDNWKTKHNRHPTEIIFYRDGLSDGQFDMCRNKEIARVRKMLDERFTQGDRPKLLVVCTVKRHNTRFLGPRGNPKACDKRRNPLPSTVFYDDVTQGEGKDFFLVSHSTLQGTTRPTHYVVLWNEIPEISIQDIAQATNHLCYTWQRSSTSVGLVPPSYYADKACDRARCYLYNLYHGYSGDETVYDPNNTRHSQLSNIDAGAVAAFRMSYI